MARRRETNVFSLSFLDAMTCGLGAVVLLYMVIQAAVNLRVDIVTADVAGEVERMEEVVLDEHRMMVELRNTLEETEKKTVQASGLARRILERIKQIQVELATYDKDTVASEEHINRLKADLKSLEEEAKRLSAAQPSEETPGRKVRVHVGDGDRQYLTGLKVGGERILVMVDSSASMLADDVVNVIRRRNLPETKKMRSEKWRQAVDTVDWLTTQFPRGSRFQVYTFSDSARPVISGTARNWLPADRKNLDKAVARLRGMAPDGPTSLYKAFAAVGTMSPRPDNLILLVDGLPTMGAAPPSHPTVNGKQRAKLFSKALDQLPAGIPVNIILFPMRGDPIAPSAYWQLAIATGGSFMAPSADWP